MDPKEKDNLTDVVELTPVVSLVDDDDSDGTVVGDDGKPVTLGGGQIVNRLSDAVRNPFSSSTTRGSNFQIRKK